MQTQDRLEALSLSAYEDELREIFRMYLEDIHPLIVQFEITKNEFPIAIQNEIRAMFGHMARASVADDADDIKSNINKMRSHAKRALLDCFKYCCVIYTDKYTNFFNRYDGVDLSYLKDGKFLSEVHAKNRDAIKSIVEAKALELSNAPDDVLFDAYQTAFNLYSELSDMLDDVYDNAEFLKHKATKKDTLTKVSFAVGAVGTLAGIIGLII